MQNAKELNKDFIAIVDTHTQNLWVNIRASLLHVRSNILNLTFMVDLPDDFYAH